MHHAHVLDARQTCMATLLYRCSLLESNVGTDELVSFTAAGPTFREKTYLCQILLGVACPTLQ